MEGTFHPVTVTLFIASWKEVLDSKLFENATALSIAV